MQPTHDLDQAGAGHPMASGRAHRIPAWLIELLDGHLPALLLLAMVGVLLLQIVFRYFFTALIWPDELAGFLYMWMVLFAVAFADRHDQLIVFSTLYDAMGPRGQFWMRVTGNAAIVAGLVAIVPSSIEYIAFMFRRSSLVIPALNLGLSYTPFLFFLGVFIVRYVARIVRDVRAEWGKGR